MQLNWHGAANSLASPANVSLRSMHGGVGIGRGAHRGSEPAAPPSTRSRRAASQAPPRQSLRSLFRKHRLNKSTDNSLNSSFYGSKVGSDVEESKVEYANENLNVSFTGNRYGTPQRPGISSVGPSNSLLPGQQTQRTGFFTPSAGGLNISGAPDSRGPLNGGASPFEADVSPIGKDVSQRSMSRSRVVDSSIEPSGVSESSLLGRSDYVPQLSARELRRRNSLSRSRRHNSSFLDDSTADGSDADEQVRSRRVTVFGFPASRRRRLLDHFKNLGEIVHTSCSGPRNSQRLHLTYKSAVHAEVALTQNGKVVDGEYMIGVVVACPEQDNIEPSPFDDVPLQDLLSKDAQPSVFQQHLGEGEELNKSRRRRRSSAGGVGNSLRRRRNSQSLLESVDSRNRSSRRRRRRRDSDDEALYAGPSQSRMNDRSRHNGQRTYKDGFLVTLWYYLCNWE